jgi:hypothetical protein
VRQSASGKVPPNRDREASERWMADEKAAFGAALGSSVAELRALTG